MKDKNEADTLFDKTLLGIMGFLIASHFVLPLIIQPQADIFIVIAIMIISVAVYVYLPPNRKRIQKRRLLQSDIKEIDTMQRIEFRRYLEELFENMGYKVELPSAPDHYEADLLLKKNGKFIAVLAKHYSKTVGVDSVQQVFSVKAYYKAHEAWIVTNNTFTKNAYDLAKKNSVKLVDRGQLINLINER
ncbi:restriction endonuclease [Domibacillus mangrovi]|nr:restriction endonuclease [Domibacillus mangrovi]